MGCAGAAAAGSCATRRRVLRNPPPGPAQPAASWRVTTSMVTDMLKRWLGKQTSEPVEKDPGPAYDLWASSYDQQPGNLVFDMEESLFSRFLDQVDVQGKTVADIGCGTGRHWPAILEHSPILLNGYDVSEGMLEQLRTKFPGASAQKIAEDGLAPLEQDSVDLLLSTLALAHIADMEPALLSWAAAIKPGGFLMLTDFHPEALVKGAKRTFVHRHQPVMVRSYAHAISAIGLTARKAGLIVCDLGERVVDDTVRHYYAQKGALATFERYRGVPMVYGFLWKKI
jgi:ubiquinone/menaquinone biosynthesis C-methylase UbiE